MSSRTFFLLAALLAGSACDTGVDSSRSSSHPASRGPIVVSDIAKPESAHWHQESKTWFTSMRAGDPQTFSGPGWLARFDQEGRFMSEIFFDGLVFPAGIAGDEDTLYVADVNRVVAIDIATRTMVEETVIDGAQFLNDVVRADDGTLFISDSFTDSVYRIVPGQQPEILISDAQLDSPNGLTLDEANGVLFIAAIGDFNDFEDEGPLFRYELESARLEVVPGVTGKFDGIVHCGDRLWITDFRGLLVGVDAAGTIVERIDIAAEYGLATTADLGADKNCETLAIPDLLGGKLLLLPVDGSNG